MFAADGTGGAGETATTARTSRSTATSLRSSSTTARAAIVRSMSGRFRRGPRRSSGPSDEIHLRGGGAVQRARLRLGAPARARDRVGRAAPRDAAVAARAGTRRLRRRAAAARRPDRADRDSGPSSGAPEGNPADAPAPPAFSSGWQLGTPDLVLTLTEPYVLRPGARDVFRNFVLPVPITTTRYMRAVEFRADRPQVLHHADLALDRRRASRARSIAPIRGPDSRRWTAARCRTSTAGRRARCRCWSRRTRRGRSIPAPTSSCCCT